MSMAKAAPAATTTVDDALRRKSSGPDIVYGGHLVANALKVEGVDLRHEQVAALVLCGA